MSKIILLNAFLDQEKTKHLLVPFISVDYMAQIGNSQLYQVVLKFPIQNQATVFVHLPEEDVEILGLEN